MGAFVPSKAPDAAVVEARIFGRAASDMDGAASIATHHLQEKALRSPRRRITLEASDKSGIKIKPSREGSLHKALGVPEGEKIPASKLRAALHSKNPAIRKKAQFAVNAKKWKHGDGFADQEFEDVSDLMTKDHHHEPVTQHYDGMMKPNPRR